MTASPASEKVKLTDCSFPGGDSITITTDTTAAGPPTFALGPLPRLDWKLRDLLAMPWARYNRLLASHPYITRSSVAAGMMSSGDIISQRVFERNEKHDVARSARFAIYGFFVHAPVLAQWFKVVDRVKFKSSAWALTAKVALDQTIWGPVSCTMFYLIMSTLEGHTAAESVEKLQSSFWSTYLSGGAVFLPTAMLTYSVIPPQHRGLFLQGVGLGWNTYLSNANASANKEVAAHELASHPSPPSPPPSLSPRKAPTPPLPAFVPSPST